LAQSLLPAGKLGKPESNGALAAAAGHAGGRLNQAEITVD
jgi:hypothetical protein